MIVPVFGESNMSGIPRCAWCARFVKRDTKVTCWRVQVADKNRQIPDSAWNIYGRVLCPECAKSATVRTPSHQPVDFSEAYGRFTAMRWHYGMYTGPQSD